MEQRRSKQLPLAGSEGELVSQAQGGSLTAFDELVSIHQERVHALAYRILAHDEDAADIQQETFVRAWLALRKFRGDAAFSTWLHRITVNLCLSRKRDRARLDVVESFDEDRLGAAGRACVESVDTRMIVRAALAAIPAPHRTLLVLRDIEGRAYEEIAEIVGASVESVRTRLCRARKLLREKMRPYLEEEES